MKKSALTMIEEVTEMLQDFKITPTELKMNE